MPPETQWNISVLVSVGKHPVTGRARRADHDARGVEMALGVVGEVPAAAIELVHAGQVSDDNEAALRGYLGMTDCPSMTLLEQPDGADVIPALAAHLERQPPRLVVTGCRAEQGEGSGLLPYALAERLGWPVINSLAAIERIEGDTATVLQALPRGQRRRLKVRLPAIVSVDSAAPVARQSAFGPARRATLAPRSGAVAMDAEQAQWQFQPARKRPKRLKIVKSASARDRFKAAAAKADASGGQVLDKVTAEQGAEAILKLLNEEGVLR